MKAPGILLAACLTLAPAPQAQANAFEKFEDAALVDHVLGAVARGYGRMHGFKVEFKTLGEEVPHASPFLVSFNRVSNTCTFFISTAPRPWATFKQFLTFFEGLPKQMVYEAFFAHEAGHCVQLKEDIDFGPVGRLQRQELFADVFALSHVERYFGKHRPAFERALFEVRRAEAGFTGGYSFAGELRKLSMSPVLQRALRVKDPKERVYTIAKAVDLL